MSAWKTVAATDVLVGDVIDHQHADHATTEGRVIEVVSTEAYVVRVQGQRPVVLFKDETIEVFR